MESTVGQTLPHEVRLPSPAPQADAALALDTVQTDPRRALQLAASALEAAPGDAAVRSMAQRAQGLAYLELDDVAAALAHVRVAVRTADRAHEAVRAAQARMSLALVLAYGGRFAEALRVLSEAAGALTGADAGRLRAQRALVLQRLGEVDRALDDYRAAVEILRAEGDRLWEARLLLNRGVLHAYRGALAAASEDLHAACRLANDLGQELLGAYALHNLGFVAARRGDVPLALSRYDEALQTLQRLGKPAALFDVDRCELLLAVRLVTEARDLAERAVSALRARDMASDLAEARLMLAHAALLQGDPVHAERAALAAHRDFRAQRRHGWATLARYAQIRAAYDCGHRTARLLQTSRRTVAALDAAGWRLPALDARVITARLALELDKVDTARRELALAAGARSRGPAALRARAWHAEALLRLAQDNRRGTYRALDAGLRILEEHQATLGATELRAHVGGHALELAQLGTQLALEQRDARRLLRWAERGRAGALRFRPARPPDDGALAADLAELRRVVAEVDAAALQGRPTDRLLRRQAQLERAVRDRARHARGAGAAAADVSLAALVTALEGRALVELVEVDGHLYGVTLVEGKARLHDLGDAAGVAGELRSLRFALRRLAAGRSGAASLAAATAGAQAAAGELERRLLAPLLGEVSSRDLVIVPTGPLHAVPWSMLPACRGRPVAVAPSATSWYRSATAARAAGGGVVLVATSEPPAAVPEASAIAAHYPGAALLHGDAARPAPVLAAMEDARLAHVATHAQFRADNPLFSCLYLTGGIVTVYDLERLRRAPDLVVLSACDSGLSAVHAGDELMGLAAALFATGTRRLVASVVPVPDAATHELMLSFHRHLRAGGGPARALARAQAETGAGDHSTLAAAAGFVCFGAG